MFIKVSLRLRTFLTLTFDFYNWKLPNKLQIRRKTVTPILIYSDSKRVRRVAARPILLTECILKQVTILHQNALFMHKIFKKFSGKGSPLSRLLYPSASNHSRIRPSLCLLFNSPFTRSSKHRANIKQVWWNPALWLNVPRLRLLAHSWSRAI